MSDDDLRFEPGDLLQDETDDPDERGTVVVLRYMTDEGGLVPAEEHEFTPGTTVYDVNQNYPPVDPVVEVAFEGWLDSNVPEWRGLLDAAVETGESFYGLVMSFCREWSVPFKSYTYPQSRLVPRRYCPDHEVRGERVEGYPPAGEPGGWACPVARCGYGYLPAVDDPLSTLDEQAVEDGEVVEA